MKKNFILFGVALALIAVTVIAAESKNATADRGKQLFNEPSLGTNGKSCNTCHPSGKGLEAAGEREDITRVINGCIAVSLQGKALDPSAENMQSLVLYLKTLGAKKQAPVKGSHPGC